MGHKTKQSFINSRIDFFYYAFRNVLLVSIPLLVVCALILSLGVSRSSAVTSGASVDSLTLSLPTSCTLSSVINSPHNTTMVSGLYEENIGKTTITTLCNDGNGYAIYASGFSDGISGNNVLISSVNNNHNISTSIYDPDNNNNPSSWSMKLDGATINNDSGDNSPTAPPIISPTYTSYNVIPHTWTRVAEKESGTTDMIKGSSFATTYAIYTSPTQHAGTYTGQVAYLLVHGSGDDNPSPYFMQNVAEWKDTLQEEQSMQAIDARDGKQYWVTKLADGHIWMTQNLDFDIEANAVLNSNTTDLNVAYDASTNSYPEYRDGYTDNGDIIYWQPASSATTIDFTGTTVTGWQNSNTTPYTANKTDSTETGHNSLGNYYNWTAAIASNDSSSLTQNTVSNIFKNPKNSICPKGWRLPTMSSESGTIPGSTNELPRLNYLYNNVSAAPLFFKKSGYTNASLNQLDIEGIYVTSSSYSGDGVWGAALRADNRFTIDQWSSGYNGRRGGWSVRCIAR